ncbi:MAG: hypothetical protein KGZ97_12330 [Bacteroidetes bacterium]|nr:hypothetical protein [Bacteroidota bacterium]
MKKLTIISAIIVYTIITAFSPSTSPQSRWLKRQQAKQPPILLETLSDNIGHKIIIEFKRGKTMNYPLMAFWIEDLEGNYIQTLYVAQSIAQGYFRHGDTSTGRWQPGPLRRPAALPYWSHKRGIKAADGLYIPTIDNPMPDAVTGATPTSNFILSTKTETKEIKTFNIMMEINQSWDWNNYWHNNKYPDDVNYKTSSQPALVYRATVDISNLQSEYKMEVIGHSHWSGANGNLYEDLSTITSALKIVGEVIIRLE